MAHVELSLLGSLPRQNSICHDVALKLLALQEPHISRHVNLL